MKHSRMGRFDRHEHSDVKDEHAIAKDFRSSRSPGSSLEPGTRAVLEPRFGHSFENVRVHNDEEADRLTRDLEAKAFTVGSDLFFRHGAYEPTTNAGMHLLAHELTHSVQSQFESLDSDSPLTIADPNGQSEQFAEQVADSVTAGTSVSHLTMHAAESASAPAIHRQEEEHHGAHPSLVQRLFSGVGGLMSRRWVDNELGDAGLKTGAAVLGALPLGAAALMAHGADEVLDAADVASNVVGVRPWYHPGIFSTLGGRRE